MTMYCSVCGDELKPEEEEDGMCESCKLSQSTHPSDEVEPEVR
jgi:NMD protein affecting ribosome stability and mRNA decay